MATTTNYSWTTPDDTALVKDGAAAIRSLGSAIDTTTKNLNPSTTLGDIEYRSSTANTNQRLGIGSSGQFLTVSAGVPAWTTLNAGGWTELTSGNFSTGASTLDLTSIAGTYYQLVLVLKDVATASSNSIRLRLNNDSTGLYTSASITTGAQDNACTATQMTISPTLIANATNGIAIITITDYTNSTAHKLVKFEFFGQTNAGPDLFTNANGIGAYRSISAITELNISNTATANWTAGTYALYGVK